jgi:dipeptidyl aminopeptidase/acylaminoacyl peptidase
MRDIRETTQYREAMDLYESLRRPGNGYPFDAAELHVSADGTRALFAGHFVDTPDGTVAVRICQIDLASGQTHVLTFGPHTDRLPRFSPDSRHIAFLSDRHKPGDFQLHMLDAASGAVRPMPRVQGWVEYLHWSPDGTRILLGVAGHGADVSGGQGAVASAQCGESLPAWMPSVETGAEEFRWRRLWMYDLATDRVHQIGARGMNVWEAVWCGNGAVIAVSSPGPAEGQWYGARVHLIDVDRSRSRELYVAQDQLGCPASSPSGRQLAIIEAVCSDRAVVAGNLRLIDVASGAAQLIDTSGIDMTYVEWRSDRKLLLAGHSGFQTVVATYDVASGAFSRVWSSEVVTTGGRYATVSGFGEGGDCILQCESFTRAPEVGVIRAGQYRTVVSYDHGSAEVTGAIAAAERICWNAPDGLEIQGWLLRPRDEGPRPLIMNVHGGPVAHARPRWPGRTGLHAVLLARRGFATFLPNPRGSSGRGQAFARRVVGDMAGADAKDLLSGVDHLVAQGIADPSRLGVTGTSYGGYMTCWLISQDTRFAAALPVAPVTNRVSQQLLCSHPQFVSMFMADHYTNPHGRYFARSPIMHAHRVRTPTLSICGALDRCTPPAEAVQFHNALLENGVESVLVIYPREGHGVTRFPAVIDFSARVVTWFEAHMRPRDAH